METTSFMERRARFCGAATGAILTLAGMVTPLGLLSPAVPAARAAFDPITEALNFSKTTERQAIYLTPQYQLQLRLIGLQNGAAALATQTADPERVFVSDLCWNGGDGCAGDVRLYD